jgi:hypothetical protein
MTVWKSRVDRRPDLHLDGRSLLAISSRRTSMVLSPLKARLTRLAMLPSPVAE